MDREGESLVNAGIGIMIAVIVLGQIAIPTINDSFTTDTKTITDEKHSSLGSVPEVVTVNNVFDGLVSDSETLVLQDSFDNTNHTLGSSNYTANYETGEFNVTASDLDGDGSPEINSTSDTYFVDYKYKPDGYLGGTTGTIMGYIDLALAVALFVAAIALVR